MSFYLLDAAAPGLVVGVMIIFMMVTIVLEAVTMLIMKYNKAGKVFLDAFIINLVSMAAGFLLLTGGLGLLNSTDIILNLFIPFLVTVLIEFALLWLLNRRKPVQKTLLVAVVINIVTYLLLLIFRIF